ncbi:M48 family metallopeptidase [Sphingomonas quercus]|uniref:M48 family metallopeptidase n=1 Tax=Sphingomonas quercus TaxID=2842451 RepID=UPI00209B8E9D|nr:M48 family metallopeptidase [Sphingomonas quercus]
MTLARLAVLALLALAPRPAPAQPSDALPAYTPGYEPTGVDERGLWMESDERERMLRDSPRRIRDGNLETYVRDVLCREVGRARCEGVRVYVMDIPLFNAMMRPNGCMEVWSGLLLRARSEAELAAVLGHEFGHFELRHSLKDFKMRRGTTDAMAWIGALGAVGAAYGYGAGTSDAQLLLSGSIFRYGRAQETEADMIGFKIWRRPAIRPPPRPLSGNSSWPSRTQPPSAAARRSAMSTGRASSTAIRPSCRAPPTSLPPPGRRRAARTRGRPNIAPHSPLICRACSPPRSG